MVNKGKFTLLLLPQNEMPCVSSEQTCKAQNRITSVKNSIRGILTRYNQDRSDLFTIAGRESFEQLSDKLLCQQVANSISPGSPCRRRVSLATALYGSPIRRTLGTPSIIFQWKVDGSAEPENAQILNVPSDGLQLRIRLRSYSPGVAHAGAG